MISQDHLTQLMIKQKCFRGYMQLIDNITEEISSPHQNHRKLAMTHPTSKVRLVSIHEHMYMCISILVFHYHYLLESQSLKCLRIGPI